MDIATISSHYADDWHSVPQFHVLLSFTLTVLVQFWNKPEMRDTYFKTGFVSSTSCFGLSLFSSATKDDLGNLMEAAKF